MSVVPSDSSTLTHLGYIRAGLTTPREMCIDIPPDVSGEIALGFTGYSFDSVFSASSMTAVGQFALAPGSCGGVINYFYGNM